MNLNEATIIGHLTDAHRSLYLYHGDGGYWRGTVVIEDDRPRMDDLAYATGREAHVFLDGSNLQVHARGDSRAEVLSRLMDTITNADDLIAAASQPESEGVA